MSADPPELGAAVPADPPAQRAAVSADPPELVLGRGGPPIARWARDLVAVGAPAAVMVVALHLPILTVLGVLPMALMTFATSSRDQVRVGQSDVVVTDWRGREKRYRWAEVLDTSWQRAKQPGPVLRMRGGRFDVPGPSYPAQIARLDLPRGERAGAQAAWEQAAAAHLRGKRAQPSARCRW